MQRYKDTEHFKALNGYEVNGAWYPRVTSIVSIKSKPALYRFYGKAGSFAEGRSISLRSAEHGTKVHDAVEAILTGGAIDRIEDQVKPAVEAFLTFIKKTSIQVNPAHVEYRLVNPKERYAGTMDALACINGKYGILDIKTSQAIYRDYNLQTAAYLKTAIDDTVDPLFKKAETRWILRIDQMRTCQTCGATLREKGGSNKIRNSYSPFPCPRHIWGPEQGIIEMKEFPEWKEDLEAFLAAKRLWEWENEDWLKKVGYL